LKINYAPHNRNTRRQRQPENIRETLDSVKDFVSELIIADIGIDAKLLKERCIHPKIITIPGRCRTLSSYGTDKKEAKEQYVLFLDPDEVIPPALWNEWAAHYRECDYVETRAKNISWASGSNTAGGGPITKPACSGKMRWCGRPSYTGSRRSRARDTA
jgi:hypothetical protein